MFLIIRIGLFFTDQNIIKTNIANARQLLEEGGTGNWDRMNRLKVYEGMYAMSVSDFTLSSLPNCSWTLSVLHQLHGWIMSSLWSTLCVSPPWPWPLMSRSTCSPSTTVSTLKFSRFDYFHRNSSISNFFIFQEFGPVEQILKTERYFAPHYAYFRKMKIKAYAQLTKEDRRFEFCHHFLKSF